MNKGFSKNTLEIFGKTIFHYVPDIMKYIDEIQDIRKRKYYTMRYLIMSEMLMFFSEGKSQRFTETAYTDSNYLENINKLIGGNINKIPDAEIYTNVFKTINKEEIENFQNKIVKHMIRGKFFEENKILGKYNCALDATRFQKALNEISKEWLSETREGKTSWYLSMLDLKLIANEMAISLMNEMINNEDKKIGEETEEDVKNKGAEQIKQDCEINAAKRLLKRLRETYPKMPFRIIADSLYPSETIISLCEEIMLEYIFVLKDKKIPTILKEFLVLASDKNADRMLIEKEDKWVLIMWINEIDYNGYKVNVIRQISKDKKTGKDSVWMWITNRKITEKNVLKIIACAKARDYIENQGFREQKVTSGIDMEHVYSKEIKAIKVIYTIIQLAHIVLQIIEHSNISGDFRQKYGSVKVFCRLFYAHLTHKLIDIKIINIKIQIRFDKKLIIS